jgi:hypothetical protein
MNCACAKATASRPESARIETPGMAKKSSDFCRVLSDMGGGLKLRGVKDHDMIGDEAPASGPERAHAPVPEKPREAVPPKEYGGRDGPDPTRYGDWEKDGRCIDF